MWTQKDLVDFIVDINMAMSLRDVGMRLHKWAICFEKVRDHMISD